MRGPIGPVTSIDARAQPVSVKVAQEDGQAFSATVSAGNPTWVEKKPGFYRYKDKYATQRGVKSLVVKLHPRKPSRQSKRLVRIQGGDEGPGFVPARQGNGYRGLRGGRAERARGFSERLYLRCRKGVELQAIGRHGAPVARISVGLGILARWGAYRPALSQAFLRSS